MSTIKVNRIENTSTTDGGVSIDTSGKVGVGTTSIDGMLHVKGAGTNGSLILEAGGTSGLTNQMFIQGHNNAGTSIGEINFAETATDQGALLFYTNGGSLTEKARIDSSGRLLVGTSSSASIGDSQYAKLQVRGNTISSAGIFSLQRASAPSSSGDVIGSIFFTDNSGNDYASIVSLADATPGSNDYPGRLVFSTTADGASSPTERMRIANDGALFSVPVYNSTTGSAANVSIGSNGHFQRSTSSAKYKTDVETLENKYADALLQCRPVWYHSTCPGDNPSWSYWGFIAEEVAEIDPRLVHWKTTEVTYDENGSAVETPCDPEPEGVQYDRFVPHLLNLIKRQGEAITELQAEVAALKAS